MGCFLGCFRIKDDGNRRCRMFSKLYSWKNRDPVVGRHQYSVVSSEVGGTPSEKAEREVLEENFDGDDSVHEKLRQEAKFLKTCGAILETPIEIRKASVPQSLPSDPSCAIIHWDQQLEKNDDLPTNDPETLIFEEEKLTSCKREENNGTTRKTVRFEKPNDSEVEKIDPAASNISPQTETQLQQRDSESPYPTPLNLVDGIQTPGTIYPQRSENFRTGRIRAQFVYPVPDLSQRSFELNGPCEDRESTLKAPPASLSKQLRPPLPGDEMKNAMDFRKEASESDASPGEDRPIIGAAAARWNDEEEAPRISPKQWDGNGIPNSTTKYKEDQKVSWHATPFEVRLEKALSDEKVYPPRKLDGRLVGLEGEGREFEM